MGETSAATAREVEETRKQMEDKVAKLSERAPEEARKLLKRVVFGIIAASRCSRPASWSTSSGSGPPASCPRPRSTTTTTEA